MPLTRIIDVMNCRSRAGRILQGAALCRRGGSPVLGLPRRRQTSWTVPAGQVGDWSLGSNWNANVPSGAVDAIVNNGGTAGITHDITATCQNLTLGTGSGTGEVDLITGFLLPSASEYVGGSNTGTFTQSGGTNTVSSSAYLFVGFRANGTYNLSDVGAVSAGMELVGYEGTGVFNQDGGTNSIPNVRLSVGGEGGAVGTYNLSGGSLSARMEIMGDWGGTGTFVQSGGTNSVASEFLLGYGYGTASSATGSYSLSSGTLNAPNQYIGCAGPGTFTQTGGTNTCRLHARARL